MEGLSQISELSQQMKQLKQLVQAAGQGSRLLPRGKSGVERKFGPQNNQKQQGRSKNKKNGGGTKAQGAGNAIGGLGRPVYIADNQSLRMAFNDIMVLNNTGTNTINFAWSLSAASSAAVANNTMAGQVPRFGTMAGLYRQFKLLSIVFEFVPVVPYTGYGQMALGIDPNPSAGAPGTMAGVIRHNHSCLFDIKSTGVKIKYNPEVDRKKDPRYTAATAGIDEDELSFGVLQCYSAGNSVVSSAQVGTLLVSMNVMFLGPY